ncbi:MAG: adenylyl-sulfate kinase [Candidatus Lokiarchaeota archaeon]
MGIKNYLVILTGLPASGKSTLSNLLKNLLEEKEKFKIKIIDPDNIRKKLMGNEFKPELEKEVRKANLKNVRKYLKEGAIVISDDLNYYTSMRHDLKEIAEDLNLPYYIIFISTPMAICIEWSDIMGGQVLMRYPENLDIADNMVQQIQISHNFTESYIINEEKEWNSISFYNEDKELIIVLVLDKYDDGTDFIPILEEFNKQVDSFDTEINGKDLKKRLKELFNFSFNVFRTRDEVISKLSNEVAQLKTRQYDYHKKFERIIDSNHLPVKAKLQFLLSINEYLTIEEIEEKIDTSRNWLKNVIETLVKNDIIGYNPEKDAYFLIV